MRDHSQHIQLSREQAVSSMLEAMDAAPAGFGWANIAAGEDLHSSEVARKCCEQVALADSVGRVLAYDVVSRCDMPSALTCAEGPGSLCRQSCTHQLLQQLGTIGCSIMQMQSIRSRNILPVV